MSFDDEKQALINRGNDTLLDDIAWHAVKRVVWRGEILPKSMFCFSMGTMLTLGSVYTFFNAKDHGVDNSGPVVDSSLSGGGVLAGLGFFGAGIYHLHKKYSGKAQRIDEKYQHKIEGFLGSSPRFMSNLEEQESITTSVVVGDKTYSVKLEKVAGEERKISFLVKDAVDRELGRFDIYKEEIPTERRSLTLI